MRRPNPLLLAALLYLSRVAALPALPEAQYFESGGARIHYVVEGQGDPVLLIHGYTASIALNWRAPGVIRELVDSYQVIALDNRGHGLSDKPTDPADYGAKMVEDAVRLLDHLKIEKAHVVGYSMGGMIAMKLVVTHPERVRSAVIGGMGWLKSDGPLANRTKDSQAIEREDPALRACIRSWGELAVTREELLKIKTPLQVMVGGNDGLRRSSVAPLEEVRPDFPVIVVEDATHASCCFKPQFKTELKAFLDRQSDKTAK